MQHLVISSSDDDYDRHGNIEDEREKNLQFFSLKSLEFHSISVKTTNPASLLASVAVDDDEEAHMYS